MYRIYNQTIKNSHKKKLDNSRQEERLIKRIMMGFVRKRIKGVDIVFETCNITTIKI